MKKLSLIFSMMIALIGFNANAAMYIVGNEPLGNGWHTNTGIEMTDNGDGTYTYDVVINGDAWFCFAEALTEGNNDDWDTFNGQYRYGPTGGSNQTVDAGAWITTQKQGNGNGSYQFHGSGDKYTVTFDKNSLKFMIDGYVEPIVYESFTVAGSDSTILGAEWNPAYEANDMTLDETDGLYKLVKENVEINNAPYTLYYKVAANHGWGQSWGNPEGENGNQDYVFNENGTYNLTFKFNFETKEVTLDAEQTEVGPVVDPLTGHLYIVGQVNGNNWNPSTAIEMTAGENNVFTLTDAVISDADAGYGFFSFMSKLGENENDWPNGYRIGATEDGYEVVSGTAALLGEWNTSHDNAFKALAGYYDITVDLVAGTVLLVAKEAPQPTVDPVYIIGNVTEYNWDAIHGVEMTYDETNKVYTAEINVTDANNGLGYFGFTKKLADPENETDVWEQIAPYRFGPMCDDEAQNWVMTEELLNQSCELDMEGSKSIEIPAGAWTVTVDLNNGLFKINGEWPTDTIEPEIPNVYLFGDVNDFAWDPTQGHMMDYAEGIYTGVVTATLREGQQVAYIGFTKQLANPDSDVDPWEQIAPYRFGPMGEGENWQMTEELLGVECALATDGSYLSIAIPAGEWTFSIDLVNNTFTINGEWPETPGPEPYEGDVYILGEVNDNGGWFPNIGVKMTRDAENNVYTATITTAGENEGYSYFSFSKKLAENDWENGGWDEINNGTDRFGAVTDGNPFLVTEEQLGNELALAYAADPAAFQIEAGQWKLTLSVDNKTLVIEKVTALRGDVNSDNAVTIGDVTDLIDYLLGGNSEGINLQNADCNLDEGVTIADVTALIDYLLSGNW
jgi:hypothetical protein